MEWPSDGPLIIRILMFLVPTGVLGWLARRFELGRWASKRIHLERENLMLLSEVNSLTWEVKELKEELDGVHRRVEESRKRAERIDSLLGSEGLAGTATPNPAATTTPGASSPPPTTT